jgi:exopolysaccharide biosynthesis protein
MGKHFNYNQITYFQISKCRLCFLLVIISPYSLFAQLKWKNVDSLFQPLPINVHVFFTNDSLEGKPNIAYYVSAPLKDKELLFTIDTTLFRRLTPTQYFEKNNQPLLVMNCTFFEFKNNTNVSAAIKNGKLFGFNVHSIAGKGKDTLTYYHSLGSALGIDKNRNASVAWLYTDSSKKYAFASNTVVKNFKDSLPNLSYKKMTSSNNLYKWKMQTAVGGGPVLLKNGSIQITNKEEIKFSSKTGLTDKHPRTAMGYTNDGQLIMLVIQGRFPTKAEGATLVQEAQIFKDLGCVEALNLDGGGSSCLLINGKQTITPSDKEGQRPVPCVFMIERSK